jgi:AP2 domain/HNH endonuclease
MKTSLTKEFVNKFFIYQEGKLYWRNKKQPGRIGKHVGSNKNKYWVTSICGIRIYNHQIVFLIFNNYIPARILFLDGNPLNYAIENLVEATHSIIALSNNLRNDNTSGYTGVSWHKKKEKWVAYIGSKATRKHLGYFNNKEDAFIAYQQALYRLYGNINKKNVRKRY